MNIYFFNFIQNVSSPFTMTHTSHVDHLMTIVIKCDFLKKSAQSEVILLSCSDNLANRNDRFYLPNY